MDLRNRRRRTLLFLPIFLVWWIGAYKVWFYPGMIQPKYGNSVFALLCGFMGMTLILVVVFYLACWLATEFSCSLWDYRKVLAGVWF